MNDRAIVNQKSAAGQLPGQQRGPEISPDQKVREQDAEIDEAMTQAALKIQARQRGIRGRSSCTLNSSNPTPVNSSSPLNPA